MCQKLGNKNWLQLTIFFRNAHFPRRKGTAQFPQFHG